MNPAGAESRDPFAFSGVDLGSGRPVGATLVDTAEKDKEISRLRKLADEQAEEVDRLNNLITLHNEQVLISGMDVKQKKNWWGGAKKSKKSSPTMILTGNGDDQIDVLQAPTYKMAKEAKSQATQLLDPKSAANTDNMMVSAARLQEVQKKYKDQIEGLKGNILDLEKQNAKSAAEINLLEVGCRKFVFCIRVSRLCTHCIIAGRKKELEGAYNKVASEH